MVEKKPVRSQIDIYNYLVEQEKNDKITTD